MTTFYIARHGQTENNLNRKFSGWVDTPLTGDGIKHAKTSGAKLKGVEFDRIISSDLGRAFVTAYIISRVIKHDGEIETHKGLREMNYGDLANMPYSMYPHLTPQENSIYVFPNGESLEIAKTRVIKTIERIASEGPDKTVLLVAHDGTMNAIRSEFGGENIGLIDAKRLNKHDTVVRFELESGQITSLEDIE